MSSFVGVKIQARTENFINATVPSRDEVRKNNYLRRRSQLTSEGFHSKIWKPFVCIGHPLELDAKSEIKASLNNEPKLDMVYSDIPIVVDHIKYVKKQIGEDEISKRKEGEEFQQMKKVLKDEIKKSEHLNFNVRVGQSFFKLIQKEKEDKANKEMQRHIIQIETGIRGPQEDSDSDSENDFVLNINKDLSRPVTSTSKHKIKSRPFTPIYNNISYLPSRASSRPKSVYSSMTQTPQLDIYDIEESSLYRQLCSLQWLLEAMVREDATNMPRVSLSWTLKNIDNGLTSTKNRIETKSAWDKYVSRTVVPIDVSKVSSHLTKVRKSYSAISSDRSNENDLQTKDDNVDIEATLFSELQKKMSSTTSYMDKNTGIVTSKMARRKRLLLKMRSVCDELDKDDHTYDDRKNLHKIRTGKALIEKTKTPQTTALIPEDHYSDKLEHMVTRNRAKSAQLINQRTAELRENVRNMSEYKITVCLNKYKDVQTNGAFHSMLKEFRYKNDYHSFFKALDASRNKIIYADWFLDLEESLKYYLENKRIRKILEKIRQYALITITKLKRSRLLSVLQLLTDWEIRHPEISASIKFITEHVVPMSEEDFQQWLKSAFPNEK